ncbi:interferon-induced protein with tetratricopeptide repeats 5-like [Trichomycterus rosablanca]|uniref:interferon-induced protein with tetratricopeptide repeats 5-like n=1 Tax=Trichomycterus rosablanca TaxID=2290929 RepID=UPI002F35701B
MSSHQCTVLRTKLTQLECHFTWDLRKEDTDLTDLLNRLQDQTELDLGGQEGAARTHSFLGFVKFLLDSNNEALSNFQRSVEVVKELHGNKCGQLLLVSYGNLAWLHYHMDNYVESESYLNKLEEIKEKYPPDSSSVLDANLLGEKGWTFLKFYRKYYDRAEECFRKALELEPEQGEWNSGLAIVLYRTETESVSSTESPTIKQLRRAIETNPDDNVVKVLLALRLCFHKEYSEAESLVETALERTSDHPHVIRYVAKYFQQKGSVDRSTALLRRALEKVPNSAFIHHQLALCYKKTKIYLQRASSHHSKDAAIKQARKQCIYHLERATELKPSFTLAMNELALQYGENQDLSKAEEMFKLARQTVEKRNENLQMFHKFYAVFQQYSMKCEPLAIEHYTKCLKLNSKTYEGKESAKHLTKIAERRIRKNSQDGDAFGILGLVHKEQGDRQRAQEYYEKALGYVHNDEYLSNLCELQLAVE